MAETTDTKLELIVTGTEENSWGDTTNDNLTIIDHSIRAVETSFADGNVALTYSAGQTRSGLALVISSATAWTADRTISFPLGTSRIHVITNKDGGGYDAVIDQGGSNSVTVPNQYTAVIRTEGGADEVYNALGNLVATGVSGEAVQITPGGGTATLDCSVGNYHYATITGAVTWTFSNPPSAGYAYRFQLELTDGGSGVQTWPGSVAWPGGTGPTLQASGVDIIEFVTRDGGTTYYGYLQMANMS